MSNDPASADAESTQSKPAFRPSLSQSLSIDNDDQRILATLGNPHKLGKSSNQTRRSPTTFALFALAAAIAGGAGYWYFITQSGSQRNSQRSGQEIAKTDVSTAAATVDTAASAKASGIQPALPVLPAAQSTPPAEQAAQIVNDPKSVTPPTATAETKLTDALEKDVKPPEAAIQKALESKPKLAAKADAAPKKKADGTLTAKANTTSNPANGRAASNAAPKAGVSSSVASTASSKTPTNASDRDINLIAALLAHNAANPTNTKPQSAVKVSTGASATSTSAPLASPTPALKPVPTPTSTSTSSKSVVAARSDTNDSVLKQCEGLDFLQREVCRLKVCDKLWETDSSCKATLSATR